LIAAGHTHKEIALALGTTLSAVQGRIRRIRAALGVKNEAELVAVAQRYGLRLEDEEHTEGPGG
jgi:DNA-binding NarL/FixJ family response regulator